MTGPAPAVQLSSSFVAVAAHEDAPSASPRTEHRTIAQRLQEAAALAISDARWFLFAMIGGAIVALGTGEWLRGDVFASIWALLSLVGAGVSSLCVKRPSRQAERRRTEADRVSARSFARRRLALAIAAMLLLIAAVPWAVDSRAWAAEPMVTAGLLMALALLCACALAPMRVFSLLSAVLPLSAALAALRADGPGASSIAAGCVIASAATFGLAWFEHRRWRRAALGAIGKDDRIVGLEAARDAAMRADQEKSRFLAIASHDLRQPVHAIGLFAATLEKRLTGSPEEPLVRNLNRAIDGLDRSFNVMLDISRLDAGAIEPRVQQFPLRDLFRRLHMHFAGQAEQKGLGLRFSPGGKSVSSDPQLLERVLGNLVQNAIKYTEQGGIVVIARSTRSHTNIEIWDTGVGIRGPDLRKVFDEFYQVGSGQRVRAQGLGMGLAIVKRLVRLMGHELTVSSRPGRGTMFRLAIAVGGLPDIQDVTAAADTLPMPLLQPRTVLVLDDEEPIREGLCLLLQEWGYDAVAAGTIEEAENAVDQMETPPDLILSDLHLGDGPDGIAGIEAIRRRCGADVAAMLITGDTTHAEIRRATESGHPVLFKPVQPRKLYDALRGLGS